MYNYVKTEKTRRQQVSVLHKADAAKPSYKIGVSLSLESSLHLTLSQFRTFLVADVWGRLQQLAGREVELVPLMDNMQLESALLQYGIRFQKGNGAGENTSAVLTLLRAKGLVEPISDKLVKVNSSAREGALVVSKEQIDSAFGELKRIGAHVDMFFVPERQSGKYLELLTVLADSLAVTGFLPNRRPFGNVTIVGSMSSSENESVESIFRIYGADMLRLHVLLTAPPHQGCVWNGGAIQASHRMLQRLWKLGQSSKAGEDSVGVQHLLEKSASRLQRMGFNAFLGELRGFINYLDIPIGERLCRELVITCAPFTPFIAEELWSRINGHTSLMEEKWPGIS